MRPEGRERAIVGSAVRREASVSLANGIESSIERLHDYGVELRTSASVDDFRGFPSRNGVLIDALAGDRIEDIRDGQNTSRERNSLPDKPVGIATAVETFMVISGNVSRHFQIPGGGHFAKCGAEQLAAHDGVRLDRLEFLFRQRAGLP